MILGIVQARMSSTRLPGKVMMPLLGQPMLARQMERQRRASSIDDLVIATTIDPSDDEIENLAADLGIDCYRGSIDDVLGRFHEAAAHRRPSHVVRLTADCPLADWTLIDRLVELVAAGAYDYASTALRPTWPDGLDAEAMSFAALDEAWHEARSPVEREHVTPFILGHPDRFRLGSLESDVDLSAMRWTVDEPNDLEFVRSVYAELYPANSAFTTNDILQLLRESPELLAINSGIERNEGLRRSIEKYVGEPERE